MSYSVVKVDACQRVSKRPQQSGERKEDCHRRPSGSVSTRSTLMEFSVDVGEYMLMDEKLSVTVIMLGGAGPV